MYCSRWRTVEVRNQRKWAPMRDLSFIQVGLKPEQVCWGTNVTSAVHELFNCPTLLSDETKATTNGHHPSMPYSEPPSEAPAEHSLSNMCGSLHLAESPSRGAFHLPVWCGLTGAECEAFLHYGHYHGFGDTAEDLSDCCQLDILHRYEQAVHL